MALRRPASSRLIFRQEDFSLPGIIMFGRYQHAVASSAIAPHTHGKDIEICFLERGEQIFRVKGLLHRMRGYDQFFTLPGEIHDTANLPEERGILYWVILSFETAGEFLGLSRAQARKLKRELLRMPTRHFRAHPDCARVLATITDLLLARRNQPASHPAHHELSLQSLMLQYLTLTIEASHQGERGFATPLMQRVLDYVEKHLVDPIHVPLLAQVARLSESRFKTRFKQEIGVPPAEYWLRKKIEQAVMLLKTRNVTRVAHDLGFSSSQYFATAFKRYTLTNPSQFHRQAAR
jgi:AraC-like DNA-binding protein